MRPGQAGGELRARSGTTSEKFKSRAVRSTVTEGGYVLRPIGRVESSLVDPTTAPKQGDEGAPDAWIVFEAAVGEALRDLRAGDEVIVLTWLDRARRDVLVVHPRGDPTRPERGVFSTRSPDRPNPVGLHPVKVVAVEGLRVLVGPLEALDGTPVLDVKPFLASDVRLR